MTEPLTDTEVMADAFAGDGLPVAPELAGVAAETVTATMSIAPNVMVSETRTTLVPVVSLGTSHFREANEMVRSALKEADTVRSEEVFAQRYLGCAMPAGKRLEIYGTPGNDMACYLDGGAIEVHGSAQDQIGNTMNGGSVVVHGRVGDAAGYAMRGGEIIVRDDCGWRVGIHMKQYEDKCPVLVIGGDAGNFLGEYMAGGVIVLLGRPGAYLASGMHGGVIYLRREALPAEVPAGLAAEALTDDDASLLRGLLDRYDALFAGEERPAGAEPAALADLGAFVALRPASFRPYGGMYAS